MKKRQRSWVGLSLGALAAFWLAAGTGFAATVNISIGDNFFSPSTRTISVGDTVVWKNNGFSTHTVTSTGGTGTFSSSGSLFSGGSYTNTFNTVGTFNYTCIFHGGQNGSITVQAANQLPAVSITSPQNNFTLIAGANATITGAATDTDGTVTRVDIYASGFLIGSVTGAPFNPFSLVVPNAPAGTYLLTAVATDNLGATNTSTGVNLQILSTNATLVVNTAVASMGSFTLSNSFGGHKYIIDAVTNLNVATFAWFPIATNTASSNDFVFTDSVLTNPVPRLYRVRQTF